jgi:MFS family permease
MTVLIILVAPVAGRVSDQVGPRWLMGIGMVLLSLSLLLFGRLEATSSFWGLLPGLLVGGFGMAITMAPTTSAAMGAVPVDKAGVGSAVINSMRQVGGSIGIAVMGALVATKLTVKSMADPRYAAQFVDGYHLAVHVGAGLILFGALVAILTVRGVRHAEPRGAAEQPAVGT